MKAFGGLVAVDLFDIAVRSGEIVGLIGPNGSGKTTVMNLLCGTLPVTGGRVLLDGEDITRRPPHTRALMGIVRTFQLANLISGFTIMENLEVAFYGQHQRVMFRETIRGQLSRVEGGVSWNSRALDILEELRITDLKDRIVTDLSCGQQRLATLAVALMTSPRFLLLDEPAAGLRWDAAENMLRAIERIVLEKEIGVLLIEHNMQVITKSASRVVAMSFGRKLAEGRAAEVLGNRQVIDAYLGEEA